MLPWKDLQDMLFSDRKQAAQVCSRWIRLVRKNHVCRRGGGVEGHTPQRGAMYAAAVGSDLRLDFFCLQCGCIVVYLITPPRMNTRGFQCSDDRRGCDPLHRVCLRHTPGSRSGGLKGNGAGNLIAITKFSSIRVPLFYTPVSDVDMCL